MDFYKIVLWLTDEGNLKATGFKLTQLKLVADVDFEQLGLDQNTQFKDFQCSIKWLHEQTKMDFLAIVQFDTLEGNDNDEIALNSDLEMIAHISKHKKA